MFGDIELNIAEVETPLNYWCDSGHIGPKQWRRTGPDGPEESTRFFRVTGKDISGCFCEPCIVLAQHQARNKKLGVI